MAPGAEPQKPSPVKREVHASFIAYRLCADCSAAADACQMVGRLGREASSGPEGGSERLLVEQQVEGAASKKSITGRHPRSRRRVAQEL